MAQRLGKFNKRVFIKVQAETKDAYGGWADRYVTYAERWCSIQEVSGSDKKSGAVLESQAEYNVTLRYDPGIKAKMIVEVQGTGVDPNPQLLITAVLNPDMAGVRTVLECKTYKDRSGGR